MNLRMCKDRNGFCVQTCVGVLRFERAYVLCYSSVGMHVVSLVPRLGNKVYKCSRVRTHRFLAIVRMHVLRFA